MKKMPNEMDDGLRPEYDLSTLRNRVRGKYADHYAEGTNVVLLDPDVASAFPDSESVNSALRTLVEIARRGGARHKSR